MRSSGHGLLFVRRFLVTFSVSVLVIGLFIISILGSVLEACIFLWIWCTLQDWPSYCHIIAHCSLLWPLLIVVSCISVLSVVTFFFISNLIDLGLFPLFFMSQANSLLIFFIFSKNQLLVLLIFVIVSFISFSFISALMFMISLLLQTLRVFLLIFIVALSVRLHCLFNVFSYFLR